MQLFQGKVSFRLDLSGTLVFYLLSILLKSRRGRERRPALKGRCRPFGSKAIGLCTVGPVVGVDRRRRAGISINLHNTPRRRCCDQTASAGIMLLAASCVMALLPATSSHRVGLRRPIRGQARSHEARSRSPLLGLADDDDDGVTVLPLFDPLTDELPFPFPCPTVDTVGDDAVPGATSANYRYAFDRPSHLRMLREVELGDDEALFGHCVFAGDGEAVNSLLLGTDSLVRTGTVGAAIRISNVELTPAAGGALAPGSFGFSLDKDNGVALASGVGAFRFVVEEVTRTIPYPEARVRALRDQGAADDATAKRTAELEAEVSSALSRPLCMYVLTACACVWCMSGR